MSRCKWCKQPKWRGDKCSNPNCSVVENRIPQRKGLPNTSRVIGMKQHGFHEPVRRASLVRDYWGNYV
jgi:hypothetical protein